MSNKSAQESKARQCKYNLSLNDKPYPISENFDGMPCNKNVMTSCFNLRMNGLRAALAKKRKKKPVQLKKSNF